MAGAVNIILKEVASFQGYYAPERMFSLTHACYMADSIPISINRAFLIWLPGAYWYYSLALNLTHRYSHASAKD